MILEVIGQEMNHCVPGWTTEDHTRPSDLMPMASQKISMAPENELIELLWQNGHVVMHNQTHRRSAAAAAESKNAQKPDPLLKVAGSLGNPSDLTLEDETACWLHYALDDSLDKEFCSEFFSEMPAIDADKLSKDVITEGEICSKFGSTIESNVLTGSASKSTNLCQQEATMPPPKSHPRGFNQQATNFENGGDTNLSYFSRPVKSNLGLLSAQSAPKRAGNWVKVKMGESSSMMTIGSSACGSNQILKQFDDNYALSNEATTSQAKGVKEDVLTIPRHDGVQRNNYETTVTSSSGGSGCSFGRAEQQSGSTRRQKRKGRDGEVSECHSEDAECESAEANKRAQGSASAHRSRAAEIHNLSERRRRDRINEKMKALQDLIPHCNKSDKASMLDEAIEYLKSLQLQVQIMWMGSGMAPMMFPSVHQYMSRMGMGMAHASMPSMHSPIQPPKVPLAGQSVPSAPTAYHTPICPSPALNQVNFPSQMPNVQFPDSYAHYIGFPHMQPPRQAMNLYSFGSQMMQHNQHATGAISSGMHVAGTVPSEKLQNGQSG